MPTVAEVINHLRKYNKLSSHIAADIWCESDVVDRASQRGIKVSREQAGKILDHIDHHKDANLGITWDTLDFYTDRYLSENPPSRRVRRGKKSSRSTSLRGMK